jgi:hypothetical protein
VLVLDAARQFALGDRSQRLGCILGAELGGQLRFGAEQFAGGDQREQLRGLVPARAAHVLLDLDHRATERVGRQSAYGIHADRSSLRPTDTFGWLIAYMSGQLRFRWKLPAER